MVLGSQFVLSQLSQFETPMHIKLSQCEHNGCDFFSLYYCFTVTQHIFELAEGK